MKWHGDYPATGLLPHEVMILRETPWFNNHAFDEDGPFLNFENTDVGHWLETLYLGGYRFSLGDQVEFRDATHSVRVDLDVANPFFGTTTVPTDMGPGYMRIWHGDLRSNIVPINIYP